MAYSLSHAGLRSSFSVKIATPRPHLEASDTTILPHKHKSDYLVPEVFLMG
jgi:hypothetical protein